MKRVSTITRISVALASLTLSVIVAAHALGLIPDTVEANLRGRKALCEAIAIDSASSIARGEVNTLRASLEAIASRNPEILSVGIRRPDGKLIMDVGGHAAQWKPPPGDTSTPSHVRVPVYEGKTLWGHVELSFVPLTPGGFGGVFGHPIVRLSGFVAGAGALVYLLYLRRALQYLDPSVVIPDRVKKMLDTLAEGVLVLDTRERIVLANAAFARAVGKPAEDLLGVAVDRLGWVWPAAASEEERAEYPWAGALRDGATRTGVPLNLKNGHGTGQKKETKDGKEQPESRAFTINAAPVLGANNSIRGALATFDDVTPIEKKNAQLHQMLEMLKQSRDEINRQNEELQALAMTDPLTGCFNRRAFFSHFEAQWGTARRYAHPIACVMVDVDHFKKVNDRHGHAMGDQVLARVANILRSLARSSDLVCRYGGEEFCVLLTHTDQEGATLAAERFRKAIEGEKFEGLSVTASLGVSWTGAGAGSPQGMLNQADEAMYAAKRGGRNRVELWRPALASAQQADPQPGAAEVPAAPEAAAAEGVPAGAHKLRRKGESNIAFGTVTALTSVLAHRDKTTADHSQRVADLSVAAARGLLPMDECFVLEVAALLHDIGKLGVPDHILLKPGPLDDEEWKAMRRHERLGSEIVAAALSDEQLTLVVRTRHAWFGGNPSAPGLPTGEQIPAAARILAIADAYDAMVTDRPYRKGRSPAEAFAELRRCAGTQFDPQLVERFVTTVEELRRAEAAATERNGHMPVEQSLSDVQQQVERIACALDDLDLSLMSALAGRLAASADRGAMGDVAKVARELEGLASVNPDVFEVVSRVNQLMDLCKSAGKPAPPAPRPAVSRAPRTGTDAVKR